MMSIFFVSIALLMVYAAVYKRLRRGRVGSAAAGTVYDLLNEDRRKALEIIVEQKAEATDPETNESPSMNRGVSTASFMRTLRAKWPRCEHLRSESALFGV